MKKRLCPLLARAVLGALLLAATTNLPAQTAPSGDKTPNAKSPDQLWAELNTAAKPSTNVTISHSPAAQEAEARRNSAVALKSQATRAREFYTQHPDHAQTAEAKKLEAMALLIASRLGDTAATAQLPGVVTSLRSDRTVPETIRAQVAGSYEFSLVAREGRKTRAARLAAIEQVARNLVVEFPGQPQGYASLLGVAVSSDDPRFSTLMQEVAQSNAPQTLKSQAGMLWHRQGLLGQSLAGILTAAKADALRAGLQPNRPTIIYTWASGNQPSIALAQFLAGRDLAKVNVIGLNLDTDTTAAQQFATQQHLSGSQHFDPLGSSGILAARLEVNGMAGLVYLTNASGNLVDLRGHYDLEAKLAALGL